MKKALKFFVAAAVTFSTVVCGAGGLTQTVQAQATDEMTEESLLSLIQTPKGQQITLDEYKSIFLSYAKVKIDKYQDDLEWKNPVKTVMNKLQSDYKTNEHVIPGVKDFYLSLLNNEAPQLRGMAINKLSYWSNDQEIINKIAGTLQNETIPYVIIQGVKCVGHLSYKNEPLANAIIAKADNDNENVREAIAAAIVIERNKDSDAIKDAARKLMHDKASSVRKIALSCVGAFGDESFIDDLEKVINDPAEQQFHAEAYRSLFFLWYKGNNTSKRAYDICVKYMSQTPRSKDVPSWTAISYMVFDDCTKYSNQRKEWKEKATYFSESEWVKILTNIAIDPKAYENTRSSAVERMAPLATKADLEKLKKKVEGLSKDTEREKLLQKIDAQIQKKN